VLNNITGEDVTVMPSERVAYPLRLAMCCRQSVVTALADLERLGFITRIRRIRRVTTPLGFTTRQITNAYDVHEPRSGLGLLAMGLFTTESRLVFGLQVQPIFIRIGSDGFATTDRQYCERPDGSAA
jgi:hypothetical protein